MSPHRSTDEQQERSAAGLDFDEDAIGGEDAAREEKMAEDDPHTLLDEIENLLPEAWRDQIREFPLAAVLLGVGVGVFLGMKKSDEVIAAGTAFVSSAAMANVSQVMDKMKG
jgi:hypothetical protein